MKEYKTYIDEDGRLHLFALCDGTLMFLDQLTVNLIALGCKDIRRREEILTEGVPEGKPWMNCLFEVSGRLPNTLWPGGILVQLPNGKVGVVNPDTPVGENRWEDSACRKWLNRNYPSKVGDGVRKKNPEEVKDIEGHHDSTAVGEFGCFLGSSWEATQNRGDTELEDKLPGSAGDSRR